MSLRRRVSLRADVSGVALGSCVVDFAEPTVPLVVAWSSGLKVTLLGWVQPMPTRKIIIIVNLMLLSGANIVLAAAAGAACNWEPVAMLAPVLQVHCRRQ
jgi:hypothetical protein